MSKHETLATALAAFQAVVPKMSKDETAKVKSDKANYTYGYAGLDQFVEIVEPVLGQHGMAVTSRTTFTPEGVFMLEVSLVHEGGERETAYWPLPDPRRAGPQDIGSAMTYGRRYLGWGLTGTFPGGIDDDGHQAQQAPRDSWENAKPAPKPAEAPVSPAAPAAPKVYGDHDIHGFHAKIASLDLDKAVVLYDWMAGKGLHERRISTGTATDAITSRLAVEALGANNSPADVAALKLTAGDRGLLNMPVTGDETLEQVMYEAAELALNAAAAEASQDIPDPATD